jgi:hypothetical protein
MKSMSFGLSDIDFQSRPPSSSSGRDAGCHLAGETDAAAGGGVLEGIGPAVGAGNDLHAVGAECVQLAQAPVDRDGLQVGVAGDEQETVPGLEQIGRGCSGIGAGDEGEERVLGDLLIAGVEQKRHAGGRLRHHAHRAVDDGILGEALAGEGGIVAGRPHGLAQRLEGEEGADAARLGVRGGAGRKPPQRAAEPAGNEALRLGHVWTLRHRRKRRGRLLLPSGRSKGG